MLQEREEHRRLLILGQGPVFSVFHHAHHLRARPAPVLEIPADRLVHRSENLARKLPIHHAPPWAPCLSSCQVRVPPRQQRGARGVARYSGETSVVHGVRGRIGRPVDRWCVGDRHTSRPRPGSAAARLTYPTAVTPGMRRYRIQHALLHRRHLIAGVATPCCRSVSTSIVFFGSKPKLLCIDRASPRMATSDEVTSTAQIAICTTSSTSRSVSRRRWRHAAAAVTNHLPWIRPHHLPHRHHAEKHTAHQRQQQRHSIRPSVRIHRHIDGNIAASAATR